MICNTGESSSGWAAKRMRSGIGNESTHWRTGTRGMTQIDQVGRGFRHAPRPAGGAKPAPLAGKGHQLLMGALGAAQAQKAVGEDAAFEKGIELVFDKVG